MENQQNQKVVNRLFDEVFNKGNISVLDEVLDPNVTILDPALQNPKSGVNYLKEVETRYKTAFKNKQIRINNMISTEDRVVVEWVCNGTHTGEFMGYAPTNKTFKITGISIYQMKNGKIMKITQSWDRLGLLDQLGEIHLPQPTSASAR